MYYLIIIIIIVVVIISYCSSLLLWLVLLLLVFALVYYYVIIIITTTILRSAKKPRIHEVWVPHTRGTIVVARLVSVQDSYCTWGLHLDGAFCLATNILKTWQLKQTTIIVACVGGWPSGRRASASGTRRRRATGWTNRFTKTRNTLHYIYIYIYIYIHTHNHIYIYIHIIYSNNNKNKNNWK